MARARWGEGAARAGAVRLRAVEVARGAHRVEAIDLRGDRQAEVRARGWGSGWGSGWGWGNPSGHLFKVEGHVGAEDHRHRDLTQLAALRRRRWRGRRR